MKLATIAVLLSALAAECPGKPSPHPVGDAAPDGGSCALACSNLASLGCQEGAAANCVAVCSHAQVGLHVDIKPTCLAAAKSKAEARSCGSVVCD